MATPAQLKKALAEARDAAAWAREAGIRRLSVRVGDAEIALELGPQFAAVDDSDAELRKLLDEEGLVQHLDVSPEGDLVSDDERTLDAAYQRLLDDKYGRTPDGTREPH